MTYEDIISEVAQELDLPIDLKNKKYKAYWQAIKEIIQELPLKENISEEEFSKLKVNFNIPSLGKLCCTPEKFINTKKRFEYIKQLREQNVQD